VLMKEGREFNDSTRRKIVYCTLVESKSLNLFVSGHMFTVILSLIYWYFCQCCKLGFALLRKWGSLGTITKVEQSELLLNNVGLG
jgi:hypothetical protein